VFGKLTSGVGLFLRTLGGAARYVTPAIKLFGRLGLSMAGAVGDDLAAGFAKLPGNAKIRAAFDSLGRFLGNRFIQAFLAGIAFVGVATEVQKHLSDEFDKTLGPEMEEVGQNAAKAIATGTIDELFTQKKAIEDALTEIGRTPPSIKSMAMADDLRAQRTAIIAEIDEWYEVGGRLGGATVNGTSDAIAYGTNEVEAATRLMATMGVRGAEPEIEAAANEVGGAVPAGIGAGILEEQGLIDTAMATLTNLIENERTPAGQAAHVIGQLISDEVANGVVDKRAGVKDAARTLRETGEAELRAFIASGGKISRKAMDELNAGLRDKDPEVRNASKRTLKVIKTETDKLGKVGKDAGKDAGEGVKTGIDSKRRAIQLAADRAENTVERNLKPNLKPNARTAINGFVSQIYSGRGRVGGAAAALARTLITRLAATIQAGLNEPGRYGYSEKGRALGGPVEAHQAYVVGEHRPELFVPDVSGTIIPYVPSESEMRPWSGGGGTTFNVATYGIPQRAETPAAVVRRIRRASRLGTVSPTPKPGTWEQV
jgi:hypothetical protein